MQSIINWFRASWTDFSDSFYINFIKDDRWKYLSDGFLVTLEIAFSAVLLGILLGLPCNTYAWNIPAMLSMKNTKPTASAFMAWATVRRSITV